MKYVWNDGAWRDPSGAPMPIPKRDGICMPRVQSDIEAYKSPLGDYWIDGRRAQREDLKRNDCVINENAPVGFDREEYAYRKAQQAKALEARKLKK